MSTVSISFRVKRTTIEYAYVQIPVTEAVMTAAENTTEEDRDNGTRRLSTHNLFARGLAHAQHPSAPWSRESEVIEPHPNQQEPVPNESSWSP